MNADESMHRHAKQHFDDYESDDELRREDITFAFDGGNFVVFLLVIVKIKY